MDQPERLARAPIVEAILDIQVTQTRPPRPDQLSALHGTLKSRFPTKQIQRNWQGEMLFRPDGAPVTKASEGPVGYRFISSDAKEIIQARPDGYSFSRLHPYTDWDTFFASSMEGWRAYAKLLKPESASRIALRYINRIELPLPFEDIGDYVLTAPQLAPELPITLKSFFFRAVTHNPKARATVVVTETIEEPKASSTHIPLIFDIDVFRVGSFPIEVESLSQLFPALRELKNRVFFGSLTPSTMELIK